MNKSEEVSYDVPASTMNRATIDRGRNRLGRVRSIIVSTLLLLFVFLSTYSGPSNLYALQDSIRYALTPLPKQPMERALAIIRQYPVIDTHIDLPILTRAFYQNQLSEITLDTELKGQVDIPRLRKGGVGGIVHSVYIPCPEDAGFPNQNSGNFTNSTWRVRDTLEQIDIAKLIIEKFSHDFALTTNVKSWKRAMKEGKIAGFLGVEGGHQLGNSLSTLRTYFALGVRYVTITHTCHNAFGDSCGMQGTPILPRWGGLSPFGKKLIKESNRLGMILDLSHTAPSTASEALSVSLAPPIFSHSNARGVHNVVRNLPDTLLRRIGRYSTSRSLKKCHSLDGEGGQGWGNNTGEAQKVIPSGDALISLNFSPDFISTRPADVKALADHADYIGSLAGRDKIAIGSDFDGIAATPIGLEDVSKYPHLIAELISRGWSDTEIFGLTNGNFLRVWAKVEKVAYQLRNEAPVTDLYELRTDMNRRDHY